MSLFHSDETFHVYACTRSVFFSNKIYKKPVTFFKNGCKKIVSITKCYEKNCFKHITLQKKLSGSPKNGNPPDKKIMVRPLQGVESRGTRCGRRKINNC